MTIKVILDRTSVETDELISLEADWMSQVASILGGSVCHNLNLDLWRIQNKCEGHLANDNNMQVYLKLASQAIKPAKQSAPVMVAVVEAIMMD